MSNTRGSRLIRVSLWAAAVMTAFGAYIFAFPDSAIGQHYDMPNTVHPLYRALTGFVLLLFALMYAWLAQQPTIYRPLLFLGALGKAGAFSIVVMLWLSKQVSLSIVTMIVVDIAFATIWLAWLLRTREPGGQSHA